MVFNDETLWSSRDGEWQLHRSCPEGSPWAFVSIERYREDDETPGRLVLDDLYEVEERIFYVMAKAFFEGRGLGVIRPVVQAT